MFCPIAIGTPEVAIIATVAIVLFGSRKIPEIGRSLAEGIQEFKAALRKESKKDEQTERQQE